jgi:hypothetical protein
VQPANAWIADLTRKYAPKENSTSVNVNLYNQQVVSKKRSRLSVADEKLKRAKAAV